VRLLRIDADGDQHAKHDGADEYENLFQARRDSCVGYFSEIDPIRPHMILCL